MVAAPRERTVTIPVPGGGSVLADVVIPRDAGGLIVFAHGSGSSRRSARNRQVAAALQDRGLATVLTDLLTVSEEDGERRGGRLRFDIGLLADRLMSVTDWFAEVGSAGLARLPLGYFGARTGAAAALLAAARQPYRVGAVVSRGGRPDLAASALDRVKAPTLLIVGGADDVVLKVNQAALAWLEGGGPHQLAVIPGATHLFEEPGALEEAARLAGDWFCRFSRIGSFDPSNPLTASNPSSATNPSSPSRPVSRPGGDGAASRR
jgi:putative phosphoribosyl transferase